MIFLQSTLPLDGQMSFDGMLNVSVKPLHPMRNTGLSIPGADPQDPVMSFGHPVGSAQRLTSTRPATVTPQRRQKGRRLDPLPEPAKV